MIALTTSDYVVVGLLMGLLISVLLFDFWVRSKQ